jgi:hypothetical protein
MNKFLKSFAVAAAITMSASAVQAANVVQYQQTDAGAVSFQLVNGGGGFTIGTIGAQSVTGNVFGLDYAGSTLNFTANGITPGISAGGLAIFDLSGGSMSLVQGGTNLLTFTFTGGSLSGSIGGNTGNVLSLAGTTFDTFSSDLIDFTSFDLNGFAISLSNISPNITFGGGTISDFTASSVGTFSAVDNGGGNAVPEPGTWAMMLAGFGLVGLSRRRQRSTTVAA